MKKNTMKRQLTGPLFILFILQLLFLFPLAASAVSEDTLVKTINQTACGLMQGHHSITEAGENRLITSQLTLALIYGSVETTEVTTDCTTSISHQPLEYRKVSRSGNYIRETICSFKNNRLSFQIIEGGKVGTTQNITVDAPQFLLFEDSLPAWMSERFHKTGDSSSIFLISPDTQEILPSTIVFENTDEIEIGNEKIESHEFSLTLPEETRRYSITSTGRLLARLHQESDTEYRLVDPDELPALEPLGSDEGQFIEGENLTIDAPQLVDYVLYRLNIPTTLNERLQLSGVYQQKIAEENMDSGSELLFQVHKTKIPQSDQVSNSSENRKWLSGTARIKPTVGEIISLAASLTRNQKNAESKINNLLVHIHQNWKTLPGETIRPIKDLLTCQEITSLEKIVLFVSLARSIGIPVRVAIGAQFDGTSFEKKLFCEVHCTSGWYQIDPASGLQENSPLLLKLFHGVGIDSVERQYQTDGGKIAITILDYRPRPQFTAKQAWRGMKNDEFIDEEYNLQLSVDRDYFHIEWTEQNQPLQIIIIPTSNPSSTQTSNLKIHLSIKEDFTTPDELAKYFSEYVAKIKAATTNTEVITSSETIASNPCNVLFYKNNQLKFKEIFIIREDLLFTIVVSGDETSLQQLTPQVEGLLSSIKIE